MDEVNIRSSLFQNAIAGIIEDGDKAKVHLNVDAELKKEDLEALIRKLT